MELIDQQRQLQEKISEIRRSNMDEIIANIARAILTYDISLDEIRRAMMGQCSVKSHLKREAKYMDPITGSTWSGRGRRPKWLKGKEDIEAFRLSGGDV
ncbi:H-NS histone family protein [Burkholderia cepacia]|uniref:H-NS histone family protein n=1 Tax=Burkholderia cepacia TaxID=292 RepID=UPI0018C89048|nr:H-NS histone family protein [Burkholderia cepacia]